MTERRPPRCCHACGAAQLTKVQQRVFDAIAQHPGISQATLGGLVSLTKGTVSYHVRTLQRLGVVRVVPGQDHERRTGRPGARAEHLVAMPVRRPQHDAELLRALEGAIASLHRVKGVLEARGPGAAATPAEPLAGAMPLAPTDPERGAAGSYADAQSTRTPEAE